jgi:hypothetical protein
LGLVQNILKFVHFQYMTNIIKSLQIYFKE